MQGKCQCGVALKFHRAWAKLMIFEVADGDDLSFGCYFVPGQFDDLPRNYPVKLRNLWPEFDQYATSWKFGHLFINCLKQYPFHSQGSSWRKEFFDGLYC